MKLGNPARRAARKISYANVVATMALFIALGGISWAAATAPKNSVATKSIKKNAVTNSKIRNNAITTRKIKTGAVLSGDVKNDALTGVDINEGTLGAVPEATKRSNDFSVLVNANSSASNADPNVARSQATEVPLISHGAITLYAKCYKDTTSDAVNFDVIAKTSANGGLIGGDTDASAVGAPALNVATAEADRVISEDETDTPTNDVDDDYSATSLVLGPDSKGFEFEAITFGRVGNPADTSPVLPAGDSCQFRLTGQKIG